MASVLELELRHRLGEFSLEASFVSSSSPLVIIGPSGGGKTLILRCIAGIIRPESGRIAVNGHTLFDRAGGVDVPAQDRRVGYVPQEYALFPHLTVEGNIGYGLRAASAQKRERVREMLDLVGLGDQRRLHPRNLSGGQRQRVALARALAVRPELLLLDEPFSALDAPTRESLFEDVRDLIRATGTPTIIVTHDRNEALQLASQVAVLMGGRIRQVADPGDVFGAPADEDVANFVGVETIAAGHVIGVEDGMAVVELGGCVLQGGTGVCRGDDVVVCLRPEDVVIGPRSELRSQASTRNHLPAAVSRITPSGAYFRIHLDAGFPLVSLITKHALEELSLTPGSEVVASFKATAVHLIRRGRR